MASAETVGAELAPTLDVALLGEAHPSWVPTYSPAAFPLADLLHSSSASYIALS